jgi:hypothetical protein
MAAHPYLFGLLIVLAIILLIVFLIYPLYSIAALFVIAGIAVIGIFKANPIALYAGVALIIVGAIFVLAQLANPGIGLAIGGSNVPLLLGWG